MTAIYWLGAHKTGTTFLQIALEESADVLVEHGLTYVGIEEFRSRWTRPLLTDQDTAGPQPSVFGSEATSLVFDENIAGLVQHVVSARGFYSDAVQRLERLVDHLELPPDDIVFAVRGYDAYLPSLYIETLRSTPFKTFDQYLQTSLGDGQEFSRLNWHHVLRRWVQAHPDARVRVYRQEDLRGHEAALFERVLGIPMGALSIPDAVDTSVGPWARSGVGMSARAIEELHRIAAERTVEPGDVVAAERRHPPSRGTPKFAPWNDDQRDLLRHAYERDLAWIRTDPDIDVIDLVPVEEQGDRGTPTLVRAGAGGRSSQVEARPGNDDGPTPADLSVVIPVRDPSDTLQGMVDDLLSEVTLNVQVILVDDASGADGAGLVRPLAADEARVTAVEHATRCGQSVAWNTGFRTAIGRYVLFLAAEGTVDTEALVTAVRRLDDTRADMAMMPPSPRQWVGGPPDPVDHEAAIWTEYLGGARDRVDVLDRLPRVLGCAPPPWCKLLRTDVYRRAGFRFSRAPVHGEILGHWSSLLNADEILLLQRPIFAPNPTPSTISSIDDTPDFMSLFDVLEEGYDLLATRPDLRNRYSHHYWSMVVRTTEAVESRIPDTDREAFRSRLRHLLLRTNLADFARIRQERDPRLANAIVERSVF